MRRISFGKWMLTPEQASEKLGEQQKELDELRRFTRSWARQQAARHQPYVSSEYVDVSLGGPPEEMKKLWLERVSRNLTCVECRTPWPCKRVGEFREFIGAIQLREYNSIDVPEPKGEFIRTAV